MFYEDHPESKECMRIQSEQLFCCSVKCDVESCPMKFLSWTLSVGTAEIAVAMAVPNKNPSDCEVRDVIRFLQANEI